MPLFYPFKIIPTWVRSNLGL